MSWRIVKLGYSRNPWRIVTASGMELGIVCSVTGISGPVCGPTKESVVAWVLDRCEWYAANATAEKTYNVEAWPTEHTTEEG